MSSKDLEEQQSDASSKFYGKPHHCFFDDLDEILTQSPRPRTPSVSTPRSPLEKLRVENDRRIKRFQESRRIKWGENREMPIDEKYYYNRRLADGLRFDKFSMDKKRAHAELVAQKRKEMAEWERKRAQQNPWDPAKGAEMGEPDNTLSRPAKRKRTSSGSNNSVIPQKKQRHSYSSMLSKRLNPTGMSPSPARSVFTAASSTSKTPSKLESTQSTPVSSVSIKSSNMLPTSTTSKISKSSTKPPLSTSSAKSLSRPSISSDSSISQSKPTYTASKISKSTIKAPQSSVSTNTNSASASQLSNASKASEAFSTVASTLNASASTTSSKMLQPSKCSKICKSTTKPASASASTMATSSTLSALPTSKCEKSISATSSSATPSKDMTPSKTSKIDKPLSSSAKSVVSISIMPSSTTPSKMLNASTASTIDKTLSAAAKSEPFTASESSQTITTIASSAIPSQATTKETPSTTLSTAPSKITSSAKQTVSDVIHKAKASCVKSKTRNSTLQPQKMSAIKIPSKPMEGVSTAPSKMTSSTKSPIKSEQSVLPIQSKTTSKTPCKSTQSATIVPSKIPPNTTTSRTARQKDPSIPSQLSETTDAKNIPAVSTSGTLTPHKSYSMCLPVTQVIDKKYTMVIPLKSVSSDTATKYKITFHINAQLTANSQRGSIEFTSEPTDHDNNTDDITTSDSKSSITSVSHCSGDDEENKSKRPSVDCQSMTSREASEKRKSLGSQRSSDSKKQYMKSDSRKSSEECESLDSKRSSGSPDQYVTTDSRKSSEECECLDSQRSSASPDQYMTTDSTKSSEECEPSDSQISSASPDQYTTSNSRKSSKEREPLDSQRSSVSKKQYKESDSRKSSQACEEPLDSQTLNEVVEVRTKSTSSESSFKTSKTEIDDEPRDSANINHENEEYGHSECLDMSSHGTVPSNAAVLGIQASAFVHGKSVLEGKQDGKRSSASVDDILHGAEGYDDTSDVKQESDSSQRGISNGNDEAQSRPDSATDNRSKTKPMIKISIVGSKSK